MRLGVMALLLLSISAPAVDAGAWLRQKGSGFVSTSLQTTRNDDNSATVYAEYGLTDRMTLGLDVHYDTDLLSHIASGGLDIETLEDVPSGSGIVFLRFPLSAPDATDKLAFHVGLGMRYFEAETSPAAEIGLSWGRSIQIGERYGWVNVDTSYNRPEQFDFTRIKLDGTIGLGLNDTTKVMFQLFNTIVDGENFTRVVPSLLYSPRKQRATYQIGSEIPTNGTQASLKIGIWYEF